MWSSLIGQWHVTPNRGSDQTVNAVCVWVCVCVHLLLSTWSHLAVFLFNWGRSHAKVDLLTVWAHWDKVLKHIFCEHIYDQYTVFPKNFHTNVIPCLLQLKPKAFLWLHNRSVQFIFQLAPNLLDGVDVRTLRGAFFNTVNWIFSFSLNTETLVLNSTQLNSSLFI